MPDALSIGDLRVSDLIAAIASDHISPGAGSAGAVALALAASCASKATAISLKHHGDDPELRAALDRFVEIARRSLAGADCDAAAFEAFIHSRDSDTVNRLILSGKTLAHLVSELTEQLAQIEPRILPSVAGDVAAARALAFASQTIETHNESETRASARG